MRLTGAARARVTLPDLILFIMSLAALSFVFPVMQDALTQNAGTLSTEESYVFMLVFPTAVIILLVAMFRTAIAGVGR